MAISEAEKRAFERVVAEVGNDPEKARATLKVFFNVLRKTNSISIELQSEVRKILEEIQYKPVHYALQEDLQKLGTTLMSVAQEEEIGKVYSTGQLAKYFGVSITTINNWIAAGRFIGVERSERNKQARISENNYWISPTEERFLVREIVETYKQKEKRGISTSPNHEEKLNRIRYIIESINFFEKRYGKSYAEVISEKGNPDDSVDWVWAREGKEWRSLLNEIGEL